MQLKFKCNLLKTNYFVLTAQYKGQSEWLDNSIHVAHNISRLLEANPGNTHTMDQQRVKATYPRQCYTVRTLTCNERTALGIEMALKERSQTSNKEVKTTQEFYMYINIIKYLIWI